MEATNPNMTKKEFTERCHYTVYGSGAGRIAAIFFDWNNDPKKGAIGYKYRFLRPNGTKKEVINDAYNILVKDNCENLCWYDIKVAKTDAYRFKIPIAISW